MTEILELRELLCPMGCGRTLQASGSGIFCAYGECPRPTAVSELLSPRHVEHEVTTTGPEFQIVHPLRERFELGGLLRCPLHLHLRNLDSPPVPDGTYIATLLGDGPGWVFRPVLPAPTLDQLDSWGDDSDRIGCRGHVDLGAFTAAARELHWRDTDEAPEFAGAAEHIWLRPLTADYAIRVYKATPERAVEMASDDERLEPCEATDPGAEPYTVIDVDQ